MTSTYRAAPEVVWLALCGLPTYFLATLPFAGMIRRRSAASRVAGAHTTSTIDESMTNVFAVQSLGGWARERVRFEAASRDSFPPLPPAGARRHLRHQLRPSRRVTLYLVMSYLIASQVADGTFTVGDFAVLTFYYLWMVGSMANLAQIWIRAQDNVVGLRRVFALMDLPSEADVGRRALRR